MNRALVVQSSDNSTKLVDAALSDMFTIEFVADFAEAYLMAEKSPYDLVMCMVNETSFEEALKLVNTLRDCDQYENSLLMILNEAKCTVQLTKAFSGGCDEYLNLPIDPVELKVRVQARSKDLVPVEQTNFYWAAELKFCVGSLRVVAVDGLGTTEDFELTPNEFRILFLLSRNLNKTLTREFILKEVWGENMHVVERTVDKHICSLRRKLGKRANYVVSVPNKGYMFHVPAKQRNPKLVTLIPAS